MIYVASPYTHKLACVRQQRYEEIADITARISLANPGRIFYSPIVHCHPLDVAQPGRFTYKYWIDHCQHMLERSEQIWVACMHGWGLSSGIRGEVEYGELSAMPVLYVNPKNLKFLERPHTDWEPPHDRKQ